MQYVRYSHIFGRKDIKRFFHVQKWHVSLSIFILLTLLTSFMKTHFDVEREGTADGKELFHLISLYDEEKKKKRASKLNEHVKTDNNKKK